MIGLDADDALSRLDRDANERLIRDFYGRRFTHGAASVVDFFHDEVVFRIIGDPSNVKGAGERVGIDAVARALREIDVEFEMTALSIESVIVDGPNIAVRWAGRFRGHGTSMEGHLEFFDHIVLRNSKFYRFTEFLDTASTTQLTIG